jgi:hypothetical protein
MLPWEFTDSIDDRFWIGVGSWGIDEVSHMIDICDETEPIIEICFLSDIRAIEADLERILLTAISFEPIGREEDAVEEREKIGRKRNIGKTPLQRAKEVPSSLIEFFLIRKEKEDSFRFKKWHTNVDRSLVVFTGRVKIILYAGDNPLRESELRKSTDILLLRDLEDDIWKGIFSDIPEEGELEWERRHRKVGRVMQSSRRRRDACNSERRVQKARE